MKLTRCTPSSCGPTGLARIADFDEWLRHPFAGFPALGNLFDVGSFFDRSSATRLATDVYEDKENYFARFEVPGVKKDDVKIELVDRMLTVSVERREKTSDGEQSYSLSRSVSVPEGVDSEKIGAKLEDGMLTVTLPKQESRKPRTIEVN